MKVQGREMHKLSLELEALRASIIRKRDPKKTCIIICSGTGCHAYGCEKVTAAFEEEKCPGCGLCVKACPVEAIIFMGKKKPVVLDQEKCIKCEACYDVCKLCAVKQTMGK